MTDALILTGWILGCALIAAIAVYSIRRFLIWLFNHIAERIEHHISTAISRPLYGDHTTLDQEYRQLITKETGE